MTASDSLPEKNPAYLVKTESIDLPGGNLNIRSLLDRQQFSDPEGLAENAGISSAQWPLFGLVWPSGLVLAAAMQTFVIEGKRVLEIGCGLAIASMVAHRRQGDITASDCHPLAGDFLAHNCQLNALLLPLKYEQANWRDATDMLGRFDLIIGSDLLYDRDQPALLSAFIDRHSNARVEVIIVDPDRGNRPSFNRKMAVLGYSCAETRVTELPVSGVEYKGRLMNYQRMS